MRDSYAGTSPAFAAWQAGEPYNRSEADSAWHALVHAMISRGADVRRGRIVSEPISDYVRYEYEATPAANLTAGEQVRWLPRRHASDRGPHQGHRRNPGFYGPFPPGVWRTRLHSLCQTVGFSGVQPE
ncbi:MAG: DUF6879 family protein, partial [Actinomadura sp.]